MTEQTQTQQPTAAVNGHAADGNGIKANASATTHTNGAKAPTAPAKRADSGPSGTSKEDTKPTKSKRRPPGGFDSTKLPAAPQGYTVRFSFLSASNLAPGDINTAASDPFLHATLKVAGLKRHKEDPDLTHRTHTVRRTLEPEWNDSWVVANVPPTGFTLKCRLYDEDSPDKNDRLGNLTIKIPRLFKDWEGIPPSTFECKKRVMSKRAYVLKAVTDAFHSNTHMTPLVRISIELLGSSDPPHGHMYTIGPATWVQHFNPMIGRLAGTKVDDTKGDEAEAQTGETSQTGEQRNQQESSASGKQANKNQRYEYVMAPRRSFDMAKY